MARPPVHGSVIVPDWHETVEGKEYLACILRKNRRREFGLLERPVLPPSVAIDTASYKIFVSGKSGVGKTALVAKLAGLEVPVVHHETTGIQTTVVFWPAKLRASDRVVMFRFEFWDCGESALKKFDHMLPACKENADAFLFLFSFTDRASFEDLPGQLTRVASEAPGVVKMVIGSKFDQYMHTDVPERDLTAFRQAWELPLLRNSCGTRTRWQPACSPAPQRTLLAEGIHGGGGSTSEGPWTSLDFDQEHYCLK
ncbi:ciliogenesis and planar polarity effector 2 isoform X2 [Peromyscus leucopus]|uniref:ciliogenesis and planar polarity effector 2 isoform X2 n=1 Tax=Peromyscus leucopus TaxID=10041 RepID=UPI00188557FB|nr:ciliogenesis and planar polarity effector 2 isoform X2 [Peromyscus leucopus]